jgi:hypothetical protein
VYICSRTSDVNALLSSFLQTGSSHTRTYDAAWFDSDLATQKALIKWNNNLPTSLASCHLGGLRCAPPARSFRLQLLGDHLVRCKKNCSAAKLSSLSYICPSLFLLPQFSCNLSPNCLPQWLPTISAARTVLLFL